MDILAKSKKVADKPARSRKKVYETLLETRKRGYAISRRPRRISDELSFSVPITANDRLLASLTFRCSSMAVPESEAIRNFVPKLKAVAIQIGQDFIDQHKTDALVSAPTEPPQSKAS